MLSNRGRLLRPRALQRLRTQSTHDGGPTPLQNDYTELRVRLREAGVFERQLPYYAAKAVFLAGTFGVCAAILLLTDSLWLRLLDAALLAFISIQIGFILHDAGHRQIFSRPAPNDAVMLSAGFFLGFSRGWWFESHNKHHARPNDLELDPDTMLYVVNFTEQQSATRTGLLRRLTKLQAYYFFPMMALEGIGAHIVSIVFLVNGQGRYRLVETVSLAAHMALYVGLLLLAMPVGHAVAFMVVHHALAGLYMGAVFAPNHKGMLVPDTDSPLDYLHRQVLTARNVAPNPVVDFMYGGLNYQIEHHLFPTIPRNKLREARTVIKQFCDDHGVSYHETSVWQSYVEIASHLDKVVRPLRVAKVPAERQFTDAV
jgi:fatty acid desaturase